MTSDRLRVGFIGLGAMGLPMATRLVAAGETLVVARDVSGPRFAAVASAERAATFRELAAKCPVVLLSLPDAAAVRAVLFGHHGVAEGAQAGSVVVDTSTIAPDAAREVALTLAERGIDYLDAPVSGGVPGAEAGTLSCMVGGDTAVFGRMRRVLEPFASRITLLGGTGAGQVAKAVNQLIVLGTIELVAEALTIATRSGVDGDAVHQALLGGFAQSRILELHGERMLRRDFVAGGVARFHTKDIEIVAKLAQSAGVATPGFDAAARQVERLIADGGGDLDHSALVTIVEQVRH